MVPMYRAGPRFNILFGGTVILARHFFRWGQRLRRFLRERCPEILRRISRRRVVSTQSAPFDSGVSSPPPDRKREEVKVNAAEPSTLLPGPSSDRRQCPHTRRERTQRWSRKFGPVVKVDRMMKETIQNEETKEPFS